MLPSPGSPMSAMRRAPSTWPALAGAWQFQMHLREGRRWLEWALAHTTDTPTVPRGRALAGLALLHWTQGHSSRRDAWPRPAAPSPTSSMTRSIAAWAIRRPRQHRPQPAPLCAGEIAPGTGAWPLARARRSLAGGAPCSCWPGPSMASVTTSSAADHVTEALALFREIGHAIGAAGALARLGRLDARPGERSCRGIGLSRSPPPLRGGWRSLFHRAGVRRPGRAASRHGQAEVAAALFGVIDAIARDTGATRLPTAGVNYDRATAAALAALGTERFADLRAAGQRLRRDDAIALARTVAIPPATRGEPDPPWLSLTAGEVTSRQQATLGTVVDGHTASLAAVTGQTPTSYHHTRPHLPRTGSPRAPWSAPDRHRDRRAALYQPQDGLQPRLHDPCQTRRVQSAAGRGDCGTSRTPLNLPLPQLQEIGIPPELFPMPGDQAALRMGMC